VRSFIALPFATVRSINAPLEQTLLQENTMKTMFAAVAFVAMSISPVLAQSASSSQGEKSAADTGANSGKNAAQKIKQQLEKAGFSDIKFLAKTFVVQAKSEDGDLVLMTFGPHGQSVSEAISPNNSATHSGSTTGSSSN
jgi:hypothetical protein